MPAPTSPRRSLARSSEPRSRSSHADAKLLLIPSGSKQKSVDSIHADIENTARQLMMPATVAGGLAGPEVRPSGRRIDTGQAGNDHTQGGRG